MKKKPSRRKTILWILSAALYVVLFLHFLVRPQDMTTLQQLDLVDTMATALVLPTQAPLAASAESIPSERNTLNLNEADAWMLCAIPGVGEELAGRIVAYREAVQGFVAVEELMRVSGIGESTFDSIREYVHVP